MGGWVRTWTASALANDELKVKHDQDAFQDAFFDRKAAIQDVRIPARASVQAKRSWSQRMMAQAAADPLAFGFRVIFAIVLFGFILFFVGIFGSCLVAALR